VNSSRCNAVQVTFHFEKSSHDGTVAEQRGHHTRTLQVRIYTPDGSAWHTQTDGVTPYDMPGVPTFVRTQYPRSGTSVMLQLLSPYTAVWKLLCCIRLCMSAFGIVVKRLELELSVGSRHVYSLQVEIVVFGGTPSNSTCWREKPWNQNPALRYSYRTRITWTYSGKMKLTPNCRHQDIGFDSLAI
jgi:hypothetical protein